MSRKEWKNEEYEFTTVRGRCRRETFGIEWCFEGLCRDVLNHENQSVGNWVEACIRGMNDVIRYVELWTAKNQFL